MWSAPRPAIDRSQVLGRTSFPFLIPVSIILAGLLLCFGILDHFKRFSGRNARNDSFLMTSEIGKEVTRYFEVDLEEHTNSWSSSAVDFVTALMIAALWPTLCKVLFRLVPEKNGGYNRLGLLSAFGLLQLVLCLLIVTKEEHFVASNELTKPAYQVTSRHGSLLLKSDKPLDLERGVLAVLAHGTVVSTTARFNGRVDVNATHIECLLNRDKVVAGTAHPFLMELRSVCQELVGYDNKMSLYTVSTNEQGVHIDLATLSAHASTFSSPKELYLDPNLISTGEVSSYFNPDSDNLRCSSFSRKDGLPAAYCLVGPRMGKLAPPLPPDPSDGNNFTASFVEKVLRAAVNSTEMNATHVTIDQYRHSWRWVGVLFLALVSLFARGIGNPGPKLTSLGESYDRGFESEGIVSESSLAPFEDASVGVLACIIATFLVVLGVMTLKISTTSPLGFGSLTLYDVVGSMIPATCFLLYDREYRMIFLNISISTGQGADLSSIAEAASPASHSKSFLSRFAVFAFSVLFLSVRYSDATFLSLPEINNPSSSSGDTASRVLKKEPTEMVTLGGDTGDQRKLGGLWYGNRNLQSGAECWQPVDENEKKFYFAIFAPKLHKPGPGIWWNGDTNVGLVATRSLMREELGRCSTTVGKILRSIEIPEYPDDHEAIRVLQNATSVSDFAEGQRAENLKIACAAAACDKIGGDGKNGRPTNMKLPGAKLTRENWLAWLVLVFVILLGFNLEVPATYRDFPIPISTLAMERLGKRDKAKVVPQRGGALNPRGLMSVLGVSEGRPVHFGLTVSPIRITPEMTFGKILQENPQDPEDWDLAD